MVGVCQGGKVYIVGCEYAYRPWWGKEYSESDQKCFHGAEHTDVFRYDPDTQQWTEITPIPSTMRDTPQCVVHNDKLVVFGHARECLGVHEGYQDIWYWELTRQRHIVSLRGIRTTHVRRRLLAPLEATRLRAV